MSKEDFYYRQMLQREAYQKQKGRYRGSTFLYTASNSGGSEGCGRLIGILIVAALVALWTDRNLDFWFSYIKGSPVNVPYFLSFVLSLVCDAMLPLNVIFEILRFVVA